MSFKVNNFICDLSHNKIEISKGKTVLEYQFSSILDLERQLKEQGYLSINTIDMIIMRVNRKMAGKMVTGNESST